MTKMKEQNEQEYDGYLLDTNVCSDYIKACSRSEKRCKPEWKQVYEKIESIKNWLISRQGYAQDFRVVRSNPTLFSQQGSFARQNRSGLLESQSQALAIT